MRVPASERYQSDPMFRAIVDQFRALLSTNNDVTPSDIREAALLAATMHEMTVIRPLLIHPGEIWDRGVTK